MCATRTGRHWRVRLLRACLSSNGGLFTPAVLRDAAAKYEEAPVFIEHQPYAYAAQDAHVAALLNPDLAGTNVAFPPEVLDGADATRPRRGDSPVGCVFDVRFDPRLVGLVATLQVESEAIANSILRLWRIGRLGTELGLSHHVVSNGLRFFASADAHGPVVARLLGIDRVLSVDIVARPAAHGRFLKPLD